MPYSPDALRRWLGMFCLVVASGLLIWGQTVFAPYLKGVAFVCYWVICLLFTLGAIVIALIDIHALRRKTREERQSLIARTVLALEEESRNAPSRAEDASDSRQPGSG